MSELRYLLYLGCLIPYRVLGYEISARKVAEKLGIKLVEMPEFSCCGLPIDPISHEMMLVLAAQNLCLAEQESMDIMTLCPGCNSTLRKTNMTLKEDGELRNRINGYLKDEGMQFKGTIDVKHFIQILIEEVGLEKIKDAVQKPLHGLKVAEHYGCHILRPTEYAGFDDPEHPTVLKNLINVTGAQCLDYMNETECCGFPIVDVDEKIPLQLAKDKLEALKEAGVQALITICPSCYLMFDVNQPRIERLFSETFGIPVLHYTELLALAMGVSPDELALDEHRVNLSNLIEGL